MRIFALGLAAVVASIFLMNTNVVRGDKKEEKDKAKFTISEVMKKAHAGGLRKKYIDGTATDEEKALLTSYYVALAANTPPKGDVEKWKKLTTTILEAYKSGDVKAYDKATNCGACHGEFKPPKKAN